MLGGDTHSKHIERPFKVLNCTPSERPDAPVANVASPDASKHWSTMGPAKTAQLELVFEHPLIVKEVELHNFGAAFVEVGLSGGPVGMEKASWASLVGSTALRSLHDVKEGLNTGGVRRLCGTAFNEDLRAGAWKRMRITLSQPFAPECPIGLRRLRIIGAYSTPPAASPASAVSPQPSAGARLMASLGDRLSDSDDDEDAPPPGGGGAATLQRLRTVVSQRSAGTPPSSGAGRVAPRA
eukprot:Hpha_TRINITY_DN20065_c0_g1::TRINITY_DN20065_c0_g1_i1::g.147715::m.147715